MVLANPHRGKPTPSSSKRTRQPPSSLRANSVSRNRQRQRRLPAREYGREARGIVRMTHISHSQDG